MHFFKYKLGKVVKKNPSSILRWLILLNQTMEKIDPYKHKQRYENWRKKVGETGIPDISKYNSDLTLQYLDDMECGYNVARLSAKGARSYIRLNTLRQKMVYFSKKFKEIYGIDKITDVTEHQVCKFFSQMRKGIITRDDGERYKSSGYYAKNFKAFWHWYMKIMKKQGVKIPDITEDLDSSQDKPQWVYLTEKEVKQLCEKAKYEYRVLIMFLFDSGIRSPTELINIKVSDFYNNCKELNIRDEVSKTFGRRIKLMLSAELIKDYIENKELSSEDHLFSMIPFKINKYIKRLATRVLGEGKSPAGQKYSELTMYDFRHISCCYWLPRYKSESALKYRFGWKKSDKIHYYSELLGMKDTIREEDILIDTTKTELEQRLTKTEKEKEILNERLKALEEQMRGILEHVKQEQVLIPRVIKKTV
jgi:integrase